MAYPQKSSTLTIRDIKIVIVSIVVLLLSLGMTCNNVIDISIHLIFFDIEMASLGAVDAIRDRRFWIESV